MNALTDDQIENLGKFIESSNRTGYYDTLSQAGFEYGSLAGGVVRGDTISGRTANAFMAERAAQLGVQIDSHEALSISLDLMRADYEARRNAGWEEIGQDEIARYHESVFLEHGLTRDAGTATVPLDVVGRHYKEYGFSSAAEAKDALWGIMMREGLGVNVYVFDEMGKFGSPQGLWLSFDSYPLDFQAAEWAGFISNIINDEAGYIVGGIGTPFPPDVDSGSLGSEGPARAVAADPAYCPPGRTASEMLRAAMLLGLTQS